jgi:2-dehydropantoate 2-reductase
VPTVRFVVVGAGAIGGVVGGLLARSGADVAFVARGGHGRRIASEGLTVRTPAETFVAHAPVVERPEDLDPGDDDVVLLAVKSQDTAGALDGLVAAGFAPRTPVACLQNGVSNEPTVAERFDRVYGVVVMAPTLHLQPGVVEAKAGPVAAILDVGRYPDGVDDVARALAAAFTAAGMVSEARPDIMRWKWTKLLLNLGNPIEVVCGPAARVGDLGRAVHREGRAVLDAAGIAYASSEEDRARRGDLLQSTRSPDTGGSTWQSVTRGGSIETDFITGEIVRLGERVGVPTPANAVLLHRAHEVAEAGRGPGHDDPADILAAAGY